MPSRFKKTRNMLRRKARRKMFKNPLRRGPTNQDRLIRLSVDTYQTVLSPAVGVAGTLTYYQLGFPLNFPTMHRNNAGTYTQITGSDTAISAAWSRLFGATAIFDEYKVQSLEITFLPSHVDVIDSATAYDTVDVPSVVYMHRDYDDITQNTAPLEAKFLNKGITPRVYTRGQKVKIKFNQLKENRNKYLNTGNYSQTPSSNVTGESLSALSSLNGGVKCLWVTSGSVVGGIIGRVYAKWDIIFRGLRDAAN